MCQSNKKALRRNLSSSELVGRAGGADQHGRRAGDEPERERRAQSVERWASQMTLHGCHNNKGLLCHFQSRRLFISLENSYNLRSSIECLI